MRATATIFLLIMTFLCQAQIDPQLDNIRSMSLKVFAGLKSGNSKFIMDQRLKKLDLMAFQKSLNDAKGKGMDAELDKLLKEIDQLVEAFEEFDEGQIREFQKNWASTQEYAEKTGFNWSDSKFLFETYEIDKRAPFHVEAKVKCVLMVPNSSGEDFRAAVNFELVMVGSKWAMLGGLLPEREYGEEEMEESMEAEEAAEEGGY